MLLRGYKEIEQKYSYDYLPYDELKFVQKTYISRAYLMDNPEIRINKRKFDNGEKIYKLSIKTDGFLERKEIKVDLNEKQFLEILSIIGYKPLKFINYQFKLDKFHIITFKECISIPSIKFAEIEYENDVDYNLNSKIFKKLSFLGEELTYNKDYYVKNIWKKWCICQNNKL